MLCNMNPPLHEYSMMTSNAKVDIRARIANIMNYQIFNTYQYNFYNNFIK